MPAARKTPPQCSNVFAGWAPGSWAGTESGLFTFPVEAGMPVLGPRGARYIAIGSHFTNPQLAADEHDHSSYDLYLTSTLREHDSGVIMTGPVVGRVLELNVGARRVPIGFRPMRCARGGGGVGAGREGGRAARTPAARV